MSFVSLRRASTVRARDDAKLVAMLQRLDGFVQRTGIFDKLDGLYNLSKRKGFDSSELEFVSNNKAISARVANVKNFHVAQGRGQGLLGGLAPLAPVTPLASSGPFGPRGESVALGRGADMGSSVPDTSMGAAGNTPFTLTPLPRESPAILRAIPGLNVFSQGPGGPGGPAASGGLAWGVLGSAYGDASRYATPAEHHQYLLRELAKNDSELKQHVEEILRAFDTEDDQFFNYVLEFWLRGRALSRAHPQGGAGGSGIGEGVLDLHR